ncbi:hypothetical protein ACFL08_00310 [Patescibacteria group bacterium]
MREMLGFIEGETVAEGDEKLGGIFDQWLEEDFKKAVENDDIKLMREVYDVLDPFSHFASKFEKAIEGYLWKRLEECTSGSSVNIELVLLVSEINLCNFADIRDRVNELIEEWGGKKLYESEEKDIFLMKRICSVVPHSVTIYDLAYAEITKYYDDLFDEAVSRKCIPLLWGLYHDYDLRAFRIKVLEEILSIAIEKKDLDLMSKVKDFSKGCHVSTSAIKAIVAITMFK